MSTTNDPRCDEGVEIKWQGSSGRTMWWKRLGRRRPIPPPFHWCSTHRERLELDQLAEPGQVHHRLLHLHSGAMVEGKQKQAAVAGHGQARLSPKHTGVVASTTTQVRRQNQPQAPPTPEAAGLRSPPTPRPQKVRSRTRTRKECVVEPAQTATQASEAEAKNKGASRGTARRTMTTKMSLRFV